MDNEKASALEELERLEREVKERRAALKLQAAKAKVPVKVDLTNPIKVQGEERTYLTIRPHTVRDIKLADEEREGWSVRLTGMLTGLTPDEVGLLSMADWDAVQAVVEGFQMRRGAIFPAQST